MKNILQHSILIVGLSFSPAALAAGFATHNDAAAGRNDVTCNGVNGSGKPAETQESVCGAGGKDVIQGSLRRNHSGRIR